MLKPSLIGPIEIKNEKQENLKYKLIAQVCDIPQALIRVSDFGVDLLITFDQPNLNRERTGRTKTSF